MKYNELKYKGYKTKIHFDARDNILYGKIENIKDLVNFESYSTLDIEREFHNAVDDYLEMRKEVGEEI